MARCTRPPLDQEGAGGKRPDEVLDDNFFNSIQIRRPIEKGFDLVTTPAYWPRWHPASVSVGGSPDHSLLVGEQVNEKFSLAGYRGLATWHVRQRSARRRWVIDGAGEKGGAATIIYMLIENPNGTSFQRELVYSVPTSCTRCSTGCSCAGACEQTQLKHYDG